MSKWSRLINVLRVRRVQDEIDAELASHLEEALDRGRDPLEARRAFGSSLRHRETSRDLRIAARVDALRTDLVFAWRRLRKSPVTSAAAILSLALALGACTSAFRLVDALLLRPLPVRNPTELHVLTNANSWPDGKPSVFDSWAYPLFQRMQVVAQQDAELSAVSYVERLDLRYDASREVEKASVQFVSGAIFDSFGLRPAQGRLLGAGDDRTPGAHPHAVLSHDYWIRRFAGDPVIVGRTFTMGTQVFEIVGVVQAPFTGTEPGAVTDLFLPTMMHGSARRIDATWVRVFARIRPGVALEPLRQRLDATLHAFQEERAARFTDMPKDRVARFLDVSLRIEPGAAGVSDTQSAYRRALIALGALVALVLLIACANVANLLGAQAAARAREMALRVSIGAGRARLVQLVLVEALLIAALAASLGALLAWWSAPLVVSLINPPENPARLVLPADGRVLGFGALLTLAVACLFGLAPAVQASGVSPLAALKDGGPPRSRRGLSLALMGVQTAFCVLVLFVAGLFVVSFERLSTLATGFSAERVMALDTVADRPTPEAVWQATADQLRALPGVERVALADRALMDGSSTNSFITVDGASPSAVLGFFRAVSPGWLGLMQIPLVTGRDFTADDASPNVAIVNETFARVFFGGANPVGRFFERGRGPRVQVVGLVRDARYRSLREPILAAAYVPFKGLAPPTAAGPSRATFIVRTFGRDPLALAATLRREVSRGRSELRVGRVQTQEALNRAHTIRERLLAMLALFFAGVALLLAAVGLYGVLHYSVLRQRRDIGIRRALGGSAPHVMRQVVQPVLLVVIAGAAAGLALGVGSSRYIESLFYDTTATDRLMLAWPPIMMIAVATLAALPSVLHALRIDPVRVLRTE
jgi:predicted permease